MPLFAKAPFEGKVERLLVGADRAAGLEKSQRAGITLSFRGHRRAIAMPASRANRIRAR